MVLSVEQFSYARKLSVVVCSHGKTLTGNGIAAEGMESPDEKAYNQVSAAVLGDAGHVRFNLPTILKAGEAPAMGWLPIHDGTQIGSLVAYRAKRVKILSIMNHKSRKKEQKFY